jgi:glycosyl-4,4'-diaponeurosporenoate acyltransferase
VEVVVVVSMSNSMSILLSMLVWPAWGLLSGWWYRRKSASTILRDRWHLRPRAFESQGSWYDSRLRIRAWKDHLPETGGWFGMSKRQLPGMATLDLERFALECRRGEMVHWAALFVTPAFAVWNSGVALVLVSVTGLAASVPFIAVLRYNRLRIERILERQTR